MKVKPLKIELNSIYKNVLKSSFFLMTIVISSSLISCKTDYKDSSSDLNENDSIRRIEEFVNLKDSASYLNQVMLIDKSNSITKASHYYEIIDGNCLKYHSYLDTLNLEFGKKRFIIFKTSDSLFQDFSNINKLKLKELIFQDNLICFEKKKPKYGIIEDIVFLPSDSIINGEESVRIVKNYMYINLDKPNLIKKNK